MNKIIHPIEPEQLMAYTDGELSGDQSAVAAAHLSECAECRELVTAVRGVSQTLRSWEVQSVDSGVPSRLTDALEENQDNERTISVAPTKWRTVLRWRPAAWVGAFAAIVLAAYVGIQLLPVREMKVAVSPVSDSQRTTRPPNSVIPPVRQYFPNATDKSAPQSATIGGLTNQGYSYSLSSDQNAPPPPPALPKSGKASAASVSGPMVIRTADLALITKDFDNARSAVEAILKRHRGYVGELKVGGSTGSGRTLTVTLRVPADQLDPALVDLKTLGRVETESQTGQDVTSQYVDLQARLANARNTEQRLTDLLRQRTGKLSDVLEVEQEVDRVRGEIEQMEAERKNMSNQVTFATLNVTIAEDYKAQLQVVPPSTWTRLSNAAVAGYKNMVDGMVDLALFLLENTPSLLFWLALLFLPARLVWKKVRRSFAA